MLHTYIKPAADFLRQHFQQKGQKLRATHAHELVAAFFGYKSRAALDSDPTLTLANMNATQLWVPDTKLIEQRYSELEGLPGKMPSGEELAKILSKFFKEHTGLSGRFWITDSLGEYVAYSYLYDEVPTEFGNQLSGEMALTNAYFDLIDVDNYDVFPGTNSVLVKITGTFSGDHDPDLVYHGDTIEFEADVELERNAGKCGFSEPELVISGVLRDINYPYGPED